MFVNGKAFHRLGDMTTHCGGVGNLVEGSPDVVVGDGAGGGSGGNDAIRPHVKQGAFDMGFRLLDSATGEPLGNVRYRLKRQDGSTVEGKTDADGRTVLEGADTSEKIVVELVPDKE